METLFSFTSYKISIDPIFSYTKSIIKPINEDEDKEFDSFSELFVDCSPNFTQQQIDTIMSYNIKSLPDILLHKEIPYKDKKRCVKCYDRINTFVEFNNFEPLDSNCILQINNNLYDIRILPDKSIRFCRILI
jgi:hypothetical protein